MQTQRDRVRALCSVLRGAALSALVLKEARATLTASFVLETDDGSISVEEWHLLDQLLMAFEKVQEAHRELITFDVSRKDPS